MSSSRTMPEVCGEWGGGCLRDRWCVGYITTILSYQSDVGDFRSPGRDNDHSIPVVGVYRQLMKKKKETGNSRRRRHKSSLSSFWMMASWVVGVCLLRARRSITPRPLRTRPQGGTLKSSHRESSSHHESSQSSSLMPANQNGGASASPVVMPRVALPGSWQKVPAKSQAMVWKGMG